jgi:hypothetical protein
MLYVSLSFSHFDDLCLSSHPNYIIEGVSLCQKVDAMLFWVKMTKKGDWIIDNIYPTCVVTEKMNCLYHLSIKNDKHDYINKYTKESQLYNITKFSLLKQIVQNYLCYDLLGYIVNLSD